MGKKPSNKKRPWGNKGQTYRVSWFLDEYLCDRDDESRVGSLLKVLVTVYCQKGMGRNKRGVELEERVKRVNGAKMIDEGGVCTFSRKTILLVYCPSNS